MTFKRLLGGTALVGVVTLMSASGAFAQFSLTVSSPPVGTFFTGTTQLEDTSNSMGAIVPLNGGSGGPLNPFINYNQPAPSKDSSLDGAFITLDVSVQKAGATLLDPNQAVTFTIDSGNTYAPAGGAGAGVVINSSTFSVPALTFNYSDGTHLTLDRFFYSNASGTANNAGGADGVIGYRDAHVAPEPGSVALMLSGLTGLVGMAAARRQRVA